MANNTPSISLDRVGFDKHIEESLTPSQKDFANLLKDWVELPRNEIILISGGPGTGKTFVVNSCLAFVKNAVQERMAHSARIACEMGGRTINSVMQLNWTAGSVMSKVRKELDKEYNVEKCFAKSAALRADMTCKTSPNIVVIDEIGAIPFYLFYEIAQYFFEKNAPVLLIGMGDKHQVKPICSVYSTFQIHCFKDQFDKDKIELRLLNLKESKRFIGRYGNVIRDLGEFVRLGWTDRMIEYVEEKYPVMDIHFRVLLRSKLALAYKNETVDYYNQTYLKDMDGTPVDIQQPKKEMLLKPNCKIFVTENNCSIVSNGTQLIFKQYLKDVDILECESCPGKTVMVSRNKYGDFPVTLGFAATIHKFQGFTIDEPAIVINFDGCQDIHLIYSALSRVKTMEQILAVQM